MFIVYISYLSLFVFCFCLVILVGYDQWLLHFVNFLDVFLSFVNEHNAYFSNLIVYYIVRMFYSSVAETIIVIKWKENHRIRIKTILPYRE